MNQPENDDTISTASSDLSLSVCELILGPGASQCKQKKHHQPTLSEKTIFYSFTSPEKDIAIRESGSLVKVEFANPSKNNSTGNGKVLSRKSSKKSVNNNNNNAEENLESIDSEDFVKVSHPETDSLRNLKSSQDVEQPEKVSNTEIQNIPSSKPSKSQNEIIEEKASKMSNLGEQSHRPILSETNAEKSRKSVNTTAETASKRFAETQTVEVQTQTKATDSDSDCKCETTFQQKCSCPECNPPKCLYTSHSSSKEEPPTRDYDETSSSSAYNAPSTPPGAAYCNCRMNSPCWKCDCQDFSDNSDDSYTTDFLNLPYQNNEEYLDLLRELERKLLARNRERVRRTRLEFEQRSRQNQNLEKPVFDYSGDESCSFFKRKLKKCRKSPSPGPCLKCCKKRVNSDILQNEKKWEKFNFVDSFSHQVAKDKSDKYSHIERSLNKSHWQLDPRSGEWIKVASFEQTQFANPLHGDSGDFGDGQSRARSGKRVECPCCCKKKYKNY